MLSIVSWENAILRQDSTKRLSSMSRLCVFYSNIYLFLDCGIKHSIAVKTDIEQSVLFNRVCILSRSSTAVLKSNVIIRMKSRTVNCWCETCVLMASKRATKTWRKRENWENAWVCICRGLFLKHFYSRLKRNCWIIVSRIRVTWRSASFKKWLHYKTF